VERDRRKQVKLDYRESSRFYSGVESSRGEIIWVIKENKVKSIGYRWRV
jgi:hypothetical protein